MKHRVALTPHPGPQLLPADTLAFPCPACRADPGALCATPSGKPRTLPHDARERLAARLRRDPAAWGLARALPGALVAAALLASPPPTDQGGDASTPARPGVSARDPTTADRPGRIPEAPTGRRW